MIIKLQRAHRECLGIKSRRRTWLTAKSLGEPSAGARPGGIRMGKPGRANPRSSLMEPINQRGEPGELKHLSTLRKRDYSVSSGERKRRSPNRCGKLHRGCRTLTIGVKNKKASGSIWKGTPKRVTVPYTKAGKLRRGS